ncbi:hypothetical protein K1719_001393 [Acacia pycnantha]|nr:hypothetical protein K1719_001393 [Acacia pycnantha]
MGFPREDADPRPRDLSGKLGGRGRERDFDCGGDDLESSFFDQGLLKLRVWKMGAALLDIGASTTNQSRLIH